MAAPEGVPPVLSDQGRAALWEGARLCLERWSALQLAVEHGFGSPAQVQQLLSDIYTWLTTSRGPLFIDELENLLDDKLVEMFCTEAEDGSIEEVADQIMALHEECLHGDFSTVERLSQAAAHSKVNMSRSHQVAEDNESEEEEDDDDNDEDEAMQVSTSISEATGMETDTGGSSLTAAMQEVLPRKGIQLSVEEQEAGWQSVPYRGRRKSGT